MSICTAIVRVTSQPPATSPHQNTRPRPGTGLKLKVYLHWIKPILYRIWAGKYFRTLRSKYTHLSRVQLTCVTMDNILFIILTKIFITFISHLHIHALEWLSDWSVVQTHLFQIVTLETWVARGAPAAAPADPDQIKEKASKFIFKTVNTWSGMMTKYFHPSLWILIVWILYSSCKLSQ